MNKPDLRYSAADFRARAAVPAVRRITTPEQVDHLQESLRTRREMMADSIIQLTVAEQQAQAVKAKADTLEQELRLKNMEGQLKGESGNEFLGQIMAEVKDLREQIAEQREAMTNQQLDELRGSLSAMAEELNNLRGGRISTVQTIKDQVQEAKELVELLAPKEVAVLPSGSEDRALTAFMVRSKLEEKQLDFKAQQAQWERDDRLALGREELALKREMAEEDLRQKQAHYDQQDRFLTDTVPKILPLVEKIATAISNKSGAAPQTSPMVSPTALPEGVEAATCQQCGGVIYYRRSMNKVLCPNPECLTEYELRDDDAGNRGDTPPSQPE